MTNYSRSVLKSNGLRHPKNLPVKFGFSPKTIPANIAKKLPPQRCSKPFLIPIFNFSHKRPTFAFTPESGYTTRLSAKDRTQRHTGRTVRGNGEPPCAAHLKAQKSAQNAFKFGTEKNRGSRITAAKLRLPAKGGLTQFGGAAGPQARAAWTLLFPQP